MTIDLGMLVIVLVIFNAATVKLLTFALTKIDVSDAVTEKAVASPPSPTPAGIATGTTVNPDMTSYSRVSGLIGSIVLATFFWAIGNIILYKLLFAPDSIKDLISNITMYFLAGASLFLPYVFNQLRAAFAP